MWKLCNDEWARVGDDLQRFDRILDRRKSFLWIRDSISSSDGFSWKYTTLKHFANSTSHPPSCYATSSTRVKHSSPYLQSCKAFIDESAIKQVITFYTKSHLSNTSAFHCPYCMWWDTFKDSFLSIKAHDIHNENQYWFPFFFILLCLHFSSQLCRFQQSDLFLDDFPASKCDFLLLFDSCAGFYRIKRVPL